MAHKLHTPICELLGSELPIIQAPMAGGATTPELVAAVSGAGALGSFGFAYTQPEDMRRAAAAVRAKTKRAFGINLLVAPQPGEIAAASQRDALAAVAPYFAELGLPAPEPLRGPFAPDLQAQLDAVQEIRPAVFTAHIGELPPERLKALHAFGIKVGGCATCVEEAKRLETLGFDFVIAQGVEAGGHRGTFLRNPYETLTGTLALTRLIVRAVRVPVVATGGIMDGAGIAAVLALGAQAAQLGTAFVPCKESGSPPPHKEAILGSREDSSLLTEKFSGRIARAVGNRFLREMNGRDAPQLAFPAQNSLTAPLRQAAVKAGKGGEFFSAYAGQAAPLARALPAAQLVERLAAETRETLGRLAALVN